MVTSQLYGLASVTQLFSLRELEQFLLVCQINNIIPAIRYLFMEKPVESIARRLIEVKAHFKSFCSMMVRHFAMVEYDRQLACHCGVGEVVCVCGGGGGCVCVS